MAGRWGWTTAVVAAIGIAPIVWAQATDIPVPDAPGVRLMLVPLPAGVDVDAALPQVIEKMGAAQGGIAQHAKPSQISVQGLPMRIETVMFNKLPGVGFFFLTVPQGRGVCVASIPLAQSRQAARPVSAACVAAQRSGGTTIPPAAPASRPAAPAPPPPGAATTIAAVPAAHADNWAKVEGVYFRNLPAFGVGGMFIMKFIPVILFKDGSFYETDDDPLEDVDLAAAKARHPNDWGRWSRNGDTFILTSAKGKPSDYKLQEGNFFKAFPASGPASLTGAYKTIGGGGNTAMGGEVMIASQNLYNFRPDGTYTNERSTGASNNGSMSGVASTFAGRRGGEGRFTVDRYTITITRPDGRTERSFFAFGSEQSPPRIDKDMLFIGNSVYVIDR